MPPPHLLKLWFVGFFSFAKCLYWCQAMPTVSPSRRASKRGRWQFESDTATDLVDGLPPAMGAPQDRETKPERSQSVCSGKALRARASPQGRRALGARKIAAGRQAAPRGGLCLEAFTVDWPH